MFEVEVLHGRSWRKKKTLQSKWIKYIAKIIIGSALCQSLPGNSWRGRRPRRSPSCQSFMAAVAPLLPERTSASVIASSENRHREEFVRLQPITAAQCLMTHLSLKFKSSLYLLCLVHTGCRRAAKCCKVLQSQVGFYFIPTWSHIVAHKRHKVQCASI